MIYNVIYVAVPCWCRMIDLGVNLDMGASLIVYKVFLGAYYFFTINSACSLLTNLLILLDH